MYKSVVLRPQTMSLRVYYVIAFGLTSFTCGSNNFPQTCTLIDSGWVCGAIRYAEDGGQYVSYRGIPYAQQPLGELRFKELQPVQPWDHEMNATEEGPICPQYDELYGRMANPQKGMSEACIFANVHVPIVRHEKKLLPILVFVHGGGFQAGSGNSDMHGPEYLVSKGMIVMTFNYRINVFGYFSMNNEVFPGNNALRDIYTFLRWVQRNAGAFGGNAYDVTLAGQSAGAASVHLMSLSKATSGLFKRVIIMSGTAIPAFYTSSPSNALLVANKLLVNLGINSTDPIYIHDQLISMPLDKIMNANRIVQSETGVVSFVPVVEGSYDGVTRILDGEPIMLIKEGRGKDIPLIIGFTRVECEFFRRRLAYLDFVGQIKKNPAAILPTRLSEAVSQTRGRELGERVMARYFNGTPTLDGYVECCTDTLFIYPAFKLAQWRAGMDGAPVYLYQFSFDGTHNVAKEALMLKYEGGGGHCEDLTFIFRTSSMLGNEQSFPPRTRDDLMKYCMTDFIANFMNCNNPFCDGPLDWPQVNASSLNYQLLNEPLRVGTNTRATNRERSMIAFFDDIEISAKNLPSF